MKQQQYPIDFVVTWLDSSNQDWQAQFAKYKKEETGQYTGLSLLSAIVIYNCFDQLYSDH